MRSIRMAKKSCASERSYMIPEIIFQQVFLL
jgi:hypothetical protein